MRRIITAAATALACTATPVWAEERARTILVLDGSGSMWGQIEGRTKIEIAQEVVGDLLGTLPGEQELGLTVYGHRRKGDCKDIETIVAPGAGTRDAISSAVNGVTPRGKTPLSDAVVAAAEALRHTEEAATVILVSDGRETCEADPCAVGRALEASGVNFTAHVIGFDVGGDAAALSELQCLADETGGRFLLAANAAELGDALAEVAEEPAPVAVTFRAIAGEGGPEITEPLLWDVLGDDGPIVEFERTARLALDLAPGRYTTSVLRPEDEASVDATFDVSEAMTVTLVLPAPLPLASLDAPEQALQGDTISVAWEGPDEKNDYVAVSDPAKPKGYVNYTITRKGTPLDLLMPPEPGVYDLRYYTAKGVVLATRSIEILPVEASLSAAATAPMGSTLPVTWSGPDYRNDYISVAVPGNPKRYVGYRYTRQGTPAEVLMPAEPGTYELHYIMAQKTTPLATITVDVTPVEATLAAEPTAIAGSELPVSWNGPDYRNDYISIAKVGDTRYETYRYTRTGADLTVKVPLEPGDYELRYVMAQDNTVLASQPLSVTDVGADLQAVETTAAGAKLLVTWDGPGYKNDYISIAEVGSKDNKHLAYTYTREGTPLTVRTPAAPGTYELRYVVTGDRISVLARQPLTLEPVTAVIEAADTAVVRGRLALHWTGPEYRGDRIELVRAGENKIYVRVPVANDAPAVIDLPEGPGDYELRYVIAQKNTVIATKPLTLTLE